MPCWLTWPTYLLSTYQCSYPFSPQLLCSTISTLRCSLWIPWKRTLSLRLAPRDFPIPTYLPGHSAHLFLLCCYSINLLFVLLLPLCLSADRRPDQNGDGVPEPDRCGSPWKAGQHFSNSSLSGHTPSVYLCQAHGHPCKLFGWGGWM